MNTESVKNRMIKRAVALAAITILIVTGMAIPADHAEHAHAAGLSSGTGEVVLSNGTANMYRMTKKIDLSDSSIDIRYAEADKKRIMADADEAVIKWLVCVSFIEKAGTMEYQNQWGDTYIKLKPEDEFKKSTGISLDNDGVRFYSPVYWYEDNYDAVKSKLEEIIKSGYEEYDKADIDNIKKLIDIGSLSRLLETSDSELQKFIQDSINISYSASLGLRAKKESIYNDKMSDYIMSKVAKKLKSTFVFDIVPLESDGSEDEKYSIGATEKYSASPRYSDTLDVKRGKLSKKYNLSEISFGGSDQFYDEILKEAINAYVNNRIPSDNKEDETYIELPDPYAWESGKTFNLGDNDGKYVQRDLMGFVTHVLQIDGGRLRSSDDSQWAFAGLRGSQTFGGDRYLLEVRDRLDEYDWGRYIMPDDKYTQTFNLHLNPAVTYIACEPTADLVSDIEFDNNGKLISISKPLFTEDEANDLYALMEARHAGSAHGIYRYKLVESEIKNKTLASGDTFADNTEEKIVDVVVTENGIQVFMFESVEDADEFYETKYMNGETLDAEFYKTERDANGRETKYFASSLLTDSITFTNKLEKEPEKEYPDIKKTIQGGKSFKIEKLTDDFAYRITTSVPKSAESFQVVDDMDKVLEFVDKDQTVVRIGGRKLSELELKSQLSQKENTLKLTVTGKQLKDLAGEKLTIDFKAKIVDGADLSGYNGVVTNIAYYIMDGEESSKTGTADVELPTYNSGSQDEPEDSDQDEGDNPGETDKVDTLVRTGDTNSILFWGVVLAVALALAAYMIKKERATR